MSIGRRSMIASAFMSLLAVNVAAAQSSTAGAGPFDPKSGRYGGSTSNAPARVPDTLKVSGEQAWAALNQVYSQMGVALSVVDSQNKVMGVLRGVQRRPVAGERLSSLLECGTGPYGPNAERSTVQLTALSHIQDIGDGRSIVETRVGGVAAPNGVSSTVNCGSSGRLEEIIVGLLRKSLGV